jgi:hypothetical protein
MLVSLQGIWLRHNFASFALKMAVVIYEYAYPETTSTYNAAETGKLKLHRWILNL